MHGINGVIGSKRLVDKGFLVVPLATAVFMLLLLTVSLAQAAFSCTVLGDGSVLLHGDVVPPPPKDVWCTCSIDLTLQVLLLLIPF
jgi:hypothetical protein